MAQRFHITIPDGDGGMPLRVTRTFAGLPITFTLISAERNRGTQWSRYCDEHVVSDSNDAAGLRSVLRATRSRDCPNILLPIMTPAFRFATENREALADRFLIPSIAAVESLDLASNKWKLYDFCSHNALPVLPSVALSDLDETLAGRGLADLDPPYLVKTSDGQGGEGFERVETRDALIALKNRLGSEEAARRFVQPLVDGYDVSLATYCEDGEIMAHTLWRAVAYGRPFAMPECIEFCDRPEILEVGRKLLRALAWEGVCDVDFFVDRHTGQAWILEVNARLFGSAPACALAGVNFVELMCERAVSRAPREWPTQRAEVFCETRALPRALRDRQLRGKLLRHPIRRLSLGLFLRDPGPDLYRWLARARSKVISLVKGLRKTPTVSGGSERKSSLLHLAGIAFLAAQLASVLYARFIPEKFFCWAPYDEHTHYAIRVVVDGHDLSKEEITERYRYPQTAWEVREMDNVLSIIRHYEQTYGAEDSANVSVTYRTNGHAEETWGWPQ